MILAKTIPFFLLVNVSYTIESDQYSQSIFFWGVLPSQLGGLDGSEAHD